MGLRDLLENKNLYKAVVASGVAAAIISTGVSTYKNEEISYLNEQKGKLTTEINFAEQLDALNVKGNTGVEYNLNIEKAKDDLNNISDKIEQSEDDRLLATIVKDMSWLGLGLAAMAKYSDQTDDQTNQNGPEM